MRVRYAGPSGAVNRDVGRHTGTGDRLEHGTVYDLPADIARRLVAGSQDWHRATPTSAPRPAETADAPTAPAGPASTTKEEVTDGTP